MDMRKYSGSSYIKVADVENESIFMHIALVREGKFGKAELVGETGGIFSVNTTNNRVLVRAYGEDSDGWIGKEIELHLGEIEYQGSMQPAVLVRPISPPIKKTKKPAPATKSPPDYDDAIEF